MRHGYIRLAAATPKIKVADCKYNTKQILELAKKAYDKDARVLVFPELCITGYTCNDLFLQSTLISGAKESLIKIVKETSRYKGMILFVGLPLMYRCKLYNVIAVMCDGQLLGFIPKRNLPNYGEFYEKRYFVSGFEECVDIQVADWNVPMGMNLLFECSNMPSLVIGAEVCEDLWSPKPPSIEHALHGATVLVNCSASNEVVGKSEYRYDLVKGQSARLISAYVYSSAGEGESTQDIVFSGNNMICENGSVLASGQLFMNACIYADIDLERLQSERCRMNTFDMDELEPERSYTRVKFCTQIKDLKLMRHFDKAPFVPSDKHSRDERCEEILNIQTYGLKKRLEHTACQSAVVGISGGLDSTLALIVTVRAFDKCSISRDKITCVTMPCFGTTDRTYRNAVTLTRQLGCTLREINIKEAVKQHFKDIGHDEAIHDTTYENSQARERTQVLMDIANQTGGMVIGTGDMSELALGWATYNGDHMSMYGVNASVPKTLVRHLVRYYADSSKDTLLTQALYDILDTPVSPELLPPQEDGNIAQKTEDIVGPYELHDFFMYHILRFGTSMQKLFRIANIAFDKEYDKETIYKWLKIFVRRFFLQQFKRSCLPDGPKVGSVALSPRGDLRMPSDASPQLWMHELDYIKETNNLEE